MQSILEQLESSEAVLLMYLADELGPADRAAVEVKLAADSSLRAELETLRAVHESVSQSLAAADAARPVSSAKGAAAQRNLSRVIRQWHIERELASAASNMPQARRSKWWIVYSSGIAAALLIGFIVWWGLQPAELRGPTATITNVTDLELRSFASDYAVWAEAEEELDAVASLRMLTQSATQ
jgi:hypothetical protein